jgi:hypothetical protein
VYYSGVGEFDWQVIERFLYAFRSICSFLIRFSLLVISCLREEGKRNADKRWSPPPHLAMRLAPHEGALVYRRSTTALT